MLNTQGVVYILLCFWDSAFGWVSSISTPVKMKGVMMNGVRMVGKRTSSKFHLKDIRTSQTLYYTDRKTGKS